MIYSIANRPNLSSTQGRDIPLPGAPPAAVPVRAGIRGRPAAGGVQEGTDLGAAPLQRQDSQTGRRRLTQSGVASRLTSISISYRGDVSSNKGMGRWAPFISCTINRDKAKCSAAVEAKFSTSLAERSWLRGKLSCLYPYYKGWERI